MKLAQYHRDAFVRAVMTDVPQHEYLGEATDILDQDVIDQLPPAVRKVYNDPALNHFIGGSHAHEYFRHGREGVYYVSLGTPSLTPREPAADAARALIDKHVEQESTHQALRAKLRAVAKSCTTRKQLAERLPEFAKYLPAESAPADRTVPVLTNVVEDFKAAGWPK